VGSATRTAQLGGFPGRKAEINDAAWEMSDVNARPGKMPELYDFMEKCENPESAVVSIFFEHLDVKYLKIIIL